MCPLRAVDARSSGGVAAERVRERAAFGRGDHVCRAPLREPSLDRLRFSLSPRVRAALVRGRALHVARAALPPVRVRVREARHPRTPPCHRLPLPLPLPLRLRLDRFSCSVLSCLLCAASDELELELELVPFHCTLTCLSMRSDCCLRERVHPVLRLCYAVLRVQYMHCSRSRGSSQSRVLYTLQSTLLH